MPAKIRIASMLRQLRRRAGIPKNNSAARAIPPPAAKSLFKGCSAPLVAAVVLTVSVEVALPVPVTEAAGAEQVGGSIALAGALVTAHEKVTEPVKPPEGATVRVVVFPVVAPGASDRLVGLGERAKPGGVALMVISTVAVAVTVPEVAITVAT
jgi:hypothetical protein